EGTPTSGARFGYRVSTALRHTGGAPTRAATRLVIPMDSPRESVIFEVLRLTGCLALRARGSSQSTAVPHHSGWRCGRHAHPLSGPNPLTPYPLMVTFPQRVRHRSVISWVRIASGPWLASCSTS